MNTRTTNRLNEIYMGIIAYSKVTYPWFGVIDFAGLAVSAVNYLIKIGEAYSWEKSECSRHMVNRFNGEIGFKMRQSDIDAVVDYMMGVGSIDNNLAGILAVIEMAR